MEAKQESNISNRPCDYDRHFQLNLMKQPPGRNSVQSQNRQVTEKGLARIEVHLHLQRSEKFVCKICLSSFHAYFLQMIHNSRTIGWKECWWIIGVK